MSDILIRYADYPLAYIRETTSVRCGGCTATHTLTRYLGKFRILDERGQPKGGGATMTRALGASETIYDLPILEIAHVGGTPICENCEALAIDHLPRVPEPASRPTGPGNFAITAKAAPAAKAPPALGELLSKY